MNITKNNFNGIKMEAPKEFIYGMISGSFGLLLSHPFDTIKTRLQNNQNINVFYTEDFYHHY